VEEARAQGRVTKRTELAAVATRDGENLILFVGSTVEIERIAGE